MYQLKRHFVAAIAAGAMCLGALTAGAASPVTRPTTQKDLQAEVDQLKAQVQELKAGQQQNQADVSAAVQAVLRDADEHSQFLAVGKGLAGYDPEKGIQITDDAGNFKVHPWLQFMPRYAFNERAQAPVHPSEEGFEIRRLKFGFDGYAFTPAFTYAVQWATNRTLTSGGTVYLEDAWATYKFTDDWGVKVGQFKDPLTRESLISSKRFMAAERSYLDDMMVTANGLAGTGDNYVQGISLVGQNDTTPLRGELAFTDGLQSGNTNFQNAAANNSNFGGAGRIEWMAVGDNWREYDQFTSLNDKDDILVLGAATDFTGEFIGPADLLMYTVDGQYCMADGFSVFLAYIGRSTFFHESTPTTHQNYNDYGALVQAAYLIPDTTIEPFIRYDYTHFDSRAGASFGVPAGFKNNVDEITVGANYYIEGHAAKITVDASYLPNGAPFSDSANDILSNVKNTFTLRAQFQLLI